MRYKDTYIMKTLKIKKHQEIITKIRISTISEWAERGRKGKEVWQASKVPVMVYSRTLLLST